MLLLCCALDTSIAPIASILTPPCCRGQLQPGGLRVPAPVARLAAAGAGGGAEAEQRVARDQAAGAETFPGLRHHLPHQEG